MASTFVLYRAAFSLGIALQYPVWIATGLLVPLSVLPTFVGRIGWFLGPYWGFRAIRGAALGPSPWPDIGMCVRRQRRLSRRRHRLPALLRPRRTCPRAR